MHKLFTEGLRNEPQKQTEIGPVPESWEMVELETTGDVVYGIQAAVANNVAAVGTPILTNKNITLDGGFDLENSTTLNLPRSATLRQFFRRATFSLTGEAGANTTSGRRLISTSTVNGSIPLSFSEYGQHKRSMGATCSITSITSGKRSFS
jgi:type I restriction enzyme S subunit